MKAVRNYNFRLTNKLKNFVNLPIVGNRIVIQIIHRIIFMFCNTKLPLNGIFLFQTRQLASNICQIRKIIFVLKISHSDSHKLVEIDFCANIVTILSVRVKSRRPGDYFRTGFQHLINSTVCKLSIVKQATAADNYNIRVGNTFKIYKPYIMTFNAVLPKIVIIIQNRTNNFVSAVAIIYTIYKMKRISYT